ncbi:hypothetical protein MPDQ_006449 [Monascus purpureus]|uniref:Kinesin motor domain-containing protein n=1 Tax=Monascus purpureus TaxID=5098 RepID=A0A507QUM2_MONPU|nr:hypothetical protein MPDQ_006449 [Monascus purpureus]
MPPRPISAVLRTPRSNSRLSISSKQGGGSRASDEDSRTAVKVAVRVRPPLKPTDPGYELIPQRFQRPMVHVTSPTNLAIDVPQGRKLFVFDRVFSETVDQQGIWEYLSESVNSFIQGYNVSILAYGQSGAGKSYTMGTSGPNEQHDTTAMGVIPRASQLLFEKLDGPLRSNRNSLSGLRTPTRYSVGSASALAKNSFEKNWQMKATYVEIYNEQLRDLLLPESTPMGDRNVITIREDAKGRIILTGLHQVNINCFDDLLSALNFGSSIRQTDSTAINAKSSRSHAVFTLNLVQRKSSAAITSPKEKRMSMPVDGTFASDASVTVDSKLHFVDLAGSERLKNTGASGERAREGISINAGLAALGKVISQLSSRQAGAHVSYRDSKLTRLLQDSLGGNAITYMIACVTPAEFHLSETLNTVQYAQRARAIQSKPMIQQVADDGDKRAAIERLKAEVAFLRQQISNAENSDRRNGLTPERPERHTSRERELQNQLLDIQERYNALSQRHAKLISELTKSSSSKDDVDDATLAVGTSSVERLKRSHSFAESVEQVVLEYEKTIQSLESSLSDTRSSLSTTESILLERETKCAYAETLNAQLQARLQKAMDREVNTESYLQDLERKLDGQSFGEEKQAAIVAELRRELSRVRESEANCEDYISTLEERLAEADQDMELMQREMERLEHVIERQRSLGKLDSLLHELDRMENGSANDQHKTNGGSHDDGSVIRAPPPNNLRHSRKRTISLDVLTEAVETAIPESDDDALAEGTPEVRGGDAVQAPEPDHEQKNSDLEALEKATANLTAKPTLAEEDDPPHSPAQSKFIADKLDTVTQELFDLRMQHESTLSEYELLETKYEEALKALAELRQDAADEARHPASIVEDLVPRSRPDSFLGDGKAPSPHQPGTQPAFSQSLSSELSLAGEPAPSQELPNGADLEPQQSEEEKLKEQEIEHMRKLLEEHQEGVNIMTQKYAELQAEHDETLGLVERLKLELQRPKPSTSPPTTPGYKTPVIRRMTSQNLMSTVDRAHRSLGALRNIGLEEFEGRPDVLQNFEMHLDAAIHELHSRVDRIQALEAENASVKKEMEMKSTIISGLTRERSSLQGGSSVDMGLVSQLRDQIVQQEIQLNTLKEAHDNREKQLLAEIESLHSLLESHEAAATTAQAAVAAYEEKERQLLSEITKLHGLLNSKDAASRSRGATPDGEKKELLVEVERLQGLLRSHEDAAQQRRAASEEQDRRIDFLEDELNEWKFKHQQAVNSLHSTQTQLNTALADLDTALASVDAMCAECNAVRKGSTDTEILSRDLANGREMREKVIQNLQLEIEEHKATIAGQLDTIASLESSHAAAKNQLSEHLAKKQEDDSELETYRQYISDLEKEIEMHKSAVASREKDMVSLQESHKLELEELQTHAAAAAQAEYESRLAVKNAEQEKVLNALRSEMSESRDELAGLLKTISGIVNSEVTVHTLAEQIQEIVSQKQHFSEKYAELMETNESLVNQLNLKNSTDTQLKEVTTSDSRDDLARLLKTVSGILNSEVTATTLTDQIEDVLAQKEHFSQKYAELMDVNEGLQKQMEAHATADTRLDELTQKSSQQDEKISELSQLVASLEQTVQLKDEEVRKKEAIIEEVTAEKQRSVRLVEELEEQITSTFDQHHNRLSVMQHERDKALEDANVKISVYEKEIESYRVRIEQLELQVKNQENSHDRSNSVTSNLRKSSSVASLPSPPPAIPLPPLPTIAGNAGSVSPPNSRHASKDLANSHLVEDQESRIRTIERNLYAEKQLTATLEEALGDLEEQSNKVKADCEAWKKKAALLDEELATLRKERNSARLSLQAVEQERIARREAEAARAQLEERMAALSKKKKKSTLNCF